MTTRKDFTRVSGGRNVIHFLRFINPSDDAEADKAGIRAISVKYNIALAKARLLGGRKFHNKQYGGGIAFYTDSLDDLGARIDALNSYTVTGWDKTSKTLTVKFHADVIITRDDITPTETNGGIVEVKKGETVGFHIDATSAKQAENIFHGWAKEVQFFLLSVDGNRPITYEEFHRVNTAPNVCSLTKEEFETVKAMKVGDVLHFGQTTEVKRVK